MVVCDNSAHCDNSLSTQLDVGGFGTALGCCSAARSFDISVGTASASYSHGG